MRETWNVSETAGRGIDVGITNRFYPVRHFLLMEPVKVLDGWSIQKMFLSVLALCTVWEKTVEYLPLRKTLFDVTVTGHQGLVVRNFIA